MKTMAAQSAVFSSLRQFRIAVLLQGHARTADTILAEYQTEYQKLPAKTLYKDLQDMEGRGLLYRSLSEAEYNGQGARTRHSYSLSVRGTRALDREITIWRERALNL